MSFLCTQGFEGRKTEFLKKRSCYKLGILCPVLKIKYQIKKGNQQTKKHPYMTPLEAEAEDHIHYS